LREADDSVALPRDLGTAASCYERAGKQGNGYSIQALRKLAADGVPEAVAAARRLRLAP